MELENVWLGAIALAIGIGNLAFGAFIRKRPDWLSTSILGRDPTLRALVGAGYRRRPEKVGQSIAFLTGAVVCAGGIALIISGLT